MNLLFRMVIRLLVIVVAAVLADTLLPAVGMVLAAVAHSFAAVGRSLVAAVLAVATVLLERSSAVAAAVVVTGTIVVEVYYSAGGGCPASAPSPHSSN